MSDVVLRLSLLFVLSMVGCRSTRGTKDVPTERDATAEAAAPLADAATFIDAPSDAPAPVPRPIGPYEMPFEKNRNVYFVVPRSTALPARLLANLHGVCNPPGYACGYWIEAAANTGFLICPEG